MEGVGEDVIQVLRVLFILTIFLISLFYLYRRYHLSHPSIHVENISLVNNVRTELLANSTTNALSNNDRTPRIITDPSTNCPICLGPISYPIETNCGHVFCGQCFLTYWRIGRWTSEVNCPSCRQKVTLLLFCFAQDSNDMSEERSEVVTNVKLYNRRFSGEPLSYSEYLQDLPTLLRHCFNDFFTMGGLLWVIRFRIIVCFAISVVYFLCPSDILPESVFGFFGIVDDLFITVFFLIYITVVYRRFLIENQAE